MPEKSPEIYFSYAWGDPKQGIDSIEYFIDELYNSLIKAGYPVKRDKMDTGYGDLISDFMREIGEADLVIIGISDKYLRSHYCMWELCEIYRNSALDAKKFIPKLLPIRIEDINFDTQTRRKYIEYWEECYNEINKLINDHPDAINAEDQKDQQKIRRIRNDFTAIIGQIKDINSLTKALLEENDFEKIKTEINSRTGLKPIKGDDFKNGKIVHNIQPKMQIGLLVRCKIKIARDISHFEQDKDFKLGNFSDPENLAISELMKVEIKGDTHAFEIIALTENEMYLESEEATTWLFDIKPLVLGNHKLTLLAYTMKERGRRNSRYYEANIEVVTEGAAKQEEKVIDEGKKDPAMGWIPSISLPKNRIEKVIEFKDNQVSVQAENTAIYKDSTVNNEYIGLYISYKKRKLNKSYVSELIFESNTLFDGILKTIFDESFIMDHIKKSLYQGVTDIKSLGTVLFELLIPNEIKILFDKKINLNLILDYYANTYPWEILTKDTLKDFPYFTMNGLLRNIKVLKSQKKESKLILQNNVLIISNPKNSFISLEHASKEAEFIKHLFDKNSFETILSDKESGNNILMKISGSSYKIVHIAAGSYSSENPNECGIMLEDNIFLTSISVKNLNYVPEFVFINSGELESQNTNLEMRLMKEEYFSMSLAYQYILLGVKAIIFTTINVGDNAARIFSETFYSHFINGNTFGESTIRARNECYKQFPNNQTWASYRCYGDPSYKIIAK